MKRIVLVLLVAVLVAGSIFASEYKGINDKNQLSIGANLGSDTGFAVRYGLGDFDLIGNVVSTSSMAILHSVVTP